MVIVLFKTLFKTLLQKSINRNRTDSKLMQCEPCLSNLKAHCELDKSSFAKVIASFVPRNLKRMGDFQLCSWMLTSTKGVSEGRSRDAAMAGTSIQNHSPVLGLL